MQRSLGRQRHFRQMRPSDGDELYVRILDPNSELLLREHVRQKRGWYRMHELRFVRRYLERAPQLTVRHVDPLIRELVHYRDLINLRYAEVTHDRRRGLAGNRNAAL